MNIGAVTSNLTRFLPNVIDDIAESTGKLAPNVIDDIAERTSESAPVLVAEVAPKGYLGSLTQDFVSSLPNTRLQDGPIVSKGAKVGDTLSPTKEGEGEGVVQKVRGALTSKKGKEYTVAALSALVWDSTALNHSYTLAARLEQARLAASPITQNKAFIRPFGGQAIPEDLANIGITEETLQQLGVQAQTFTANLSKSLSEKEFVLR